MRTIRIRKLLSLLLALIMVAGILPITALADWEDGVECEYCGCYIWDDYICDYSGDHCGPSAANDCYIEHHCFVCTECLDNCSEYCENHYEGPACEDCLEEWGEHCRDCGVCGEDEALCDGCKLCYECGGECSHGFPHLCLQCHLDEGWACPDCGACLIDNEDGVCEYCHRCQECVGPICMLCEHCLECALDNEYHCVECGECICAGVSKCVECNICENCTDVCPEIDGCAECVGVCEACGYCGNCVTLCANGDYCSNCAEFCEECGLCENCVDICINGDACSECAEICQECGYCSNCAEICPNGNGCSECAEICEECGMCENCATLCINGDGCSECAELCGNCGTCSNCTHVCENGDGCEDCCMICENCGMCENCAEICENGDGCSECSEMCGDCGHCENCATICPGGDSCSECTDEQCENCGTCEDCATICIHGDGCGDCAYICNKCGSCSNCAEVYKDCSACSNCAGASFIPGTGVSTATLTFDKATGTIVGSTKAQAELKIPAQVGGVALTEIKGSAFYNDTTITSVTIADGIATIGPGAFMNCSNMTSVTIPASVTYIGPYAFSGCTKLRSVIFLGNAPGGVDSTTFPNAATLYFHQGKSGWTTPTWKGYTTMPMSVTNSSATTPYAVEGGNIYINKAIGAVVGCDKDVTAVVIPSKLHGSAITSISDTAFQDRMKLKSVTINNGITRIDDGAFYGCTALVSVSLPDSLIAIGETAFSGCTNLPDVTIPTGVKNIGAEAFCDCESIGGIYFKGDAPEVGSHAFPDEVTIYCSPFKTGWSIPTWNGYSTKHWLTGAVGRVAYAVEGGNIYIDKATGMVVDSDKNVTSVVIPDKVDNIKITGIDDEAFMGRSKLQKVTFSEGLSRIGDAAFYTCSALVGVTFPNSLLTIGEAAFEGCYNMTDLTIPANVTSIGNEAFCDCESVRNMFFKGNAPKLGSSAFPEDVTLYYISGKTGWATPTWNGYKTVEQYVTTLVVPIGQLRPSSTRPGYQAPSNTIEMRCPHGSDITLAVDVSGATAYQWIMRGDVISVRDGTREPDENMPNGNAATLVIPHIGMRHNYREIYCRVTTANGTVSTKYVKLILIEALEVKKEEPWVAPTIESKGVNPSATGIAQQSTQTVEINGTKVELQAYALIDPETGYPTNYIKIRDIAHALNGTARQFDVTWDGAVNMVVTSPYDHPNGQENQTPYFGDQPYKKNSAPTKVNGQVVEIGAFIITDSDGGDSTYYKLRDVGQALGFNVGYSFERGIFIEPDTGYNFDN